MQVPEHDRMRAAEDHHWWYAVLRGLVEHALAGRLPSHGRLLDAGCGTGGMLEFLSGKITDLEIAGVDASAHAVRHCQQRGLHTVQAASVESLPFADATFDAVLSLDVLYHAGVDEERALAEMHRVLRCGGLLLLNLPAFPALRGSHDAAVSGARRYVATQVRALLEQADLAVETLHYWNASFFLPLLLWRNLSRLQAPGTSSDLNLTPSWMNSLLTRWGRADATLCQALHIPLGSSVFAVARKCHPSPAGRTPAHG